MEILDKLSIYLGRWCNVPVTLHWSWVVMMAIILFISPSIALNIVGLFFMVLLHEFGHCLAAQYYNACVEDITLFPFGGAARIHIPWQPIPELVVSLAGPFVNLLLIAPLLIASQWSEFMQMMLFYNIVLLIFNMIPAFPMDGGRVLRSVLNLIWDDHYRATLWATRIGQIFCVLFGVWGVMSGNLNLLIIGIFIFFAARQELEASWEKSAVVGVSRNEFMATLESTRRRLEEIDREYGRYRRD